MHWNKATSILKLIMTNNKLCMLCEKPLSDDDRIAIDSITHAGMKYAVTKKVDEKKAILADLEPYSPASIHFSCYDDIDKKLS